MAFIELPKDVSNIHWILSQVLASGYVNGLFSIFFNKADKI